MLGGFNRQASPAARTHAHNFQPWALGIPGKFDLARYKATYHLPPEGYEAIARDLPIVLQGLRDVLIQNNATVVQSPEWFGSLTVSHGAGTPTRTGTYVPK
ncbi:hypothetical protein FQZ97_1055490 [compost metagenome]